MEDKKLKKQVPLRISTELYAELERWAEDDFRSLNGEIEYLLTECVRYRRRGKKGLTPPLFFRHQPRRHFKGGQIAGWRHIYCS